MAPTTRNMWREFLVALVFIPLVAEAFYLPGVHPTNFGAGEKVKMKVGKLSSAKTHLPYNFYDLPFCRPKGVTTTPANLGEVLAGDLMHNTNYEFFMKRNESCKLLCTIHNFHEQGPQYELFTKLVDEGPYVANLRMDNMPAIIMKEAEVEQGGKVQTKLVAQGKGYPIGYKEGDQYYVVNHLNFWISYHDLEPNDEGGVLSRVVGLYLTATTVKVAEANKGSCEGGLPPQPAYGDITFTYSVKWVPSSIRWASRWDPLLEMDMQDKEMNWFAITNSLVITFCLSFMVAIILIRTLRRDVAMYNQALEEENDAFEFGWKLIATDVFRPPPRSELLATLVGTGEQLLCMTIAILAISLLGFFSPSNRGALMTTAFVFFALLGLVAGYTSARVYKMFGGVQRKIVVLRTALWLPGFFFTIFMLLDLWIWHEGSVGAVPIGTLLLIIAFWFGISVPLVFFGAFLGYKSKDVEFPVKPTTIPRQLPELPFYMHTVVMSLVGGAVVFAIVFVQVFFVFTKVWLNEFVYMFGFLFAVFVIMVVATAELSIIAVYLSLCSEDYRWVWKGFLTPTSAGAYMFLLTLLYFAPSVPTSTSLTVIMLITYSGMLSLAFSLITGAVGFYASLWFVVKIYSAIKMD